MPKIISTAPDAVYMQLRIKKDDHARLEELKKRTGLPIINLLTRTLDAFEKSLKEKKENIL